MVTEIRDILIVPPSENPYETFRERIACLTVSKRTRITQLLEQEEFGDSTASQSIERQQRLAEGTGDNSIVCHVFFYSGYQCKLALVSLGESIPIEALAAVADHVGELLATQTSTASHVDNSIISLIKELREEQGCLLARVDQLADNVARLSVNKTANCSRSKFRSQSK